MADHNVIEKERDLVCAANPGGPSDTVVHRMPTLEAVLAPPGLEWDSGN
jgi:hypothetical protein